MKYYFYKSFVNEWINRIGQKKCCSLNIYIQLKEKIIKQNEKNVICLKNFVKINIQTTKTSEILIAQKKKSGKKSNSNIILKNSFVF